MNLNENRRLFQIILAIVAVIILVAIISAIYLLFNRKPSVTVEPLPSPTVQPNVIIPPDRAKTEELPVDVKQIKQKIIAGQIANHNGDILLYNSDSFKIEYIPTPDVFFVTIAKEPVQNARQDAQRWFLNFGLAQADLCNLPVRFELSTKELDKNNPGFNSLPEGCNP